MPAEPDDLDGCDVGPLMGRRLTLDAFRPWVVLFAGIDPSDHAAILARAAEWRALFPGRAYAP